LSVTFSDAEITALHLGVVIVGPSRLYFRVDGTADTGHSSAWHLLWNSVAVVFFTVLLDQIGELNVTVTIEAGWADTHSFRVFETSEFDALSLTVVVFGGQRHNWKNISPLVDAVGHYVSAVGVCEVLSVFGVGIGSSDGDRLAGVVDLALFRFNAVVKNLTRFAIGDSYTGVAHYSVLRIRIEGHAVGARAGIESKVNNLEVAWEEVFQNVLVAKEWFRLRSKASIGNVSDRPVVLNSHLHGLLEALSLSLVAFFDLGIVEEDLSGEVFNVNNTSQAGHLLAIASFLEV